MGEDEKRLAELGYKQDLNRSLVGLLQLRDLVLDHLDPRRLLHELRCRLQQRRPDLDLVDLADPRVFILIIGFTMSELVSAYPTSGGIYWWASKLGGSQGRLLHRLAQPDRPGRSHRRCLVRLRDLHRPHDQHLLGVLRAVTTR
jgi:hypothetical protein